MNKVMLIGNVGKDPDVRYYDVDQAVARVSLATSERGYTLKNGTQVPERTDWHNLVFFRQLAKVVEQYVRKGDKLYVEGRLRYTVQDSATGKRRYVTEIMVENMEMLNPKQQQVPGGAKQAGGNAQRTGGNTDNDQPLGSVVSSPKIPF